MSDLMKDLILREVATLLKDAIGLRHRFHQIPERSFEEVLTSKLIAQELRKAGIEVKENLVPTGVTATISGTRPGKVVALRADMDGLVLEDKTLKPYASKHPGLSHGCGHDGHIVCVLKAFLILSKLRDHLAGQVRVIFQPAEETGDGAQSMLEAGALGNPPPASIFTLHSWPELKCGVVASKPGVITSGNDLFTITVKGKGGHGARPRESISPILSAGRIAQAVSDLTCSEGDGSLSCVVSVGVIRGGEQPNTIPDEALIKGTIRSPNEVVRQDLLEKFKATVLKICSRERVDTVVDIQQYCPPVYNHPDLYHLFEKTADELLGPERRIAFSTQSAGSEDFGFYTQKIPGILIRLGMGSECAPLHTSGFDFCDASLASGITLLVGLAMGATESDFKITQRVQDETL